jgi:hypothetical protein
MGLLEKAHPGNFTPYSTRNEKGGSDLFGFFRHKSH